MSDVGAKTKRSPWHPARHSAHHRISEIYRCGKEPHYVPILQWAACGPKVGRYLPISLGDLEVARLSSNVAVPGQLVLRRQSSRGLNIERIRRIFPPEVRF